jgi:dihydroxyacid dehydratase/phosphogluconate dehydratase
LCAIGSPNLSLAKLQQSVGSCINQTIVLDLGKEIKKNVQNDNMLAWQYNTVGVSDGITMGGEGLSCST